ncbi:hypothetical protein JCM11641_006038 [Rhodosporidiobolus odoratus]
MQEDSPFSAGRTPRAALAVTRQARPRSTSRAPLAAPATPSTQELLGASSTPASGIASLRAAQAIGTPARARARRSAAAGVVRVGRGALRPSLQAGDIEASQKLAQRITLVLAEAGKALEDLLQVGFDPATGEETGQWNLGTVAERSFAAFKGNKTEYFTNNDFLDLESFRPLFPTETFSVDSPLRLVLRQANRATFLYLIFSSSPDPTTGKSARKSVHQLKAAMEALLKHVSSEPDAIDDATIKLLIGLRCQSYIAAASVSRAPLDPKLYFGQPLSSILPASHPADRSAAVKFHDLQSSVVEDIGPLLNDWEVLRTRWRWESLVKEARDWVEKAVEAERLPPGSRDGGEVLLGRSESDGEEAVDGDNLSHIGKAVEGRSMLPRSTSMEAQQGQFGTARELPVGLFRTNSSEAESELLDRGETLEQSSGDRISEFQAPESDSAALQEEYLQLFSRETFSIIRTSPEDPRAALVPAPPDSALSAQSDEDRFLLPPGRLRFKAADNTLYRATGIESRSRSLLDRQDDAVKILFDTQSQSSSPIPPFSPRGDALEPSAVVHPLGKQQSGSDRPAMTEPAQHENMADENYGFHGSNDFGGGFVDDENLELDLPVAYLKHDLVYPAEAERHASTWPAPHPQQSFASMPLGGPTARHGDLEAFREVGDTRSQLSSSDVGEQRDLDRKKRVNADHEIRLREGRTAKRFRPGDVAPRAFTRDAGSLAPLVSLSRPPPPRPSSSMPSRVFAANSTQPHRIDRRTRGQNNPWTDAETRFLEVWLKETGCDYARIVRLHGRNGVVTQTLKTRSNVDLKDRARNIRARYEKAGQGVPSWLEKAPSYRGAARPRPAAPSLTDEE